jgi:hypothetical protein
MKQQRLSFLRMSSHTHGHKETETRLIGKDKKKREKTIMVHHHETKEHHHPHHAISHDQQVKFQTEPIQQPETLKSTFSSKQNFIQSNMFRFMRFGSIDGSLLVISALFGLSIDAWLASKIGARGYGPILGAAMGNVISDGIAAIPEGSLASAGAFMGASLPIVPLAACLMIRAPLSQRVKMFTGAFSGAILLGAFTVEKILEEKEKHVSD